MIAISFLMQSALFLILAATFVIFCIKKPVWMLAFLFISVTGFFGIVKLTDTPHFPLTGLHGALYIPDIFLLCMVAIMVLRCFTGKNGSIRSSTSYPIAALLILTGLQGVRAFYEGGNPQFMLREMKNIFYYTTYFLILASVQHKKSLIGLIKVLVLIGILASSVLYFQSVTGSFAKATHVVFRTDYAIFQSLTPGLNLIACVFLMMFSIATGKAKNIKFTKIISCWTGGALLLTLVRNIWISSLAAMTIIIVFNTRNVMKTVAFLVILILSFAIVAFVIQHITESADFTFIIRDRLLSAYTDIRDKTGTFEGRIKLMSMRWDYMINNNPMFGYGFKGTNLQLYPRGDRWLGIQSHIAARTLDPTIVSGHNIIGDIAVRYGLSGFFVFGWILFTVFQKAIRLLRSLPASWEKSLACGLLAFNVQAAIMSCFGGSLYLWTLGAIALTPSWAILELIDRFHRRDVEQKLTSGKIK